MNEVEVLRRRPQVRFRRIEDEAVVLLQDDGEVVVLNEVGARMLELVDGRRSLAAVIEIIAGEYEVERDQLQTDVLGFADELLAAGVLEPVVD